MRLDHLPASVAFCDVETTGLGHHDRIVSFGGIGMVSRDQGCPAYLYLVFNPGTENHRDAERIHGFSDSALRLQDPFAIHAADVWRFLTSYELLVAHNAAFDLRFINRELRLSGLPALTRPVYCTMKGYRALELGGSASLSAVCRRIKLARAGDLHSGIEDAWLAMQIYLWLHGCPLQIRLRGSLPRSPSNLRHAESGPYRVDHTGRTPFRHVRQARRASYSANLHHHGRPASRAKTASW
jgi:DNA polymerase III subunit epsilon